MTTATQPTVADRVRENPLVEPKVLSYFRATKTAKIRAKPLCLILTDKTMAAKLLLDTLEGTQSLRAGSTVCFGMGGDYWQQKRETLLAKYTITDVDDDGWLTCTPKPDNAVDAAEIGPNVIGTSGFSLIGLWGKKAVLNGKKAVLNGKKAVLNGKKAVLNGKKVYLQWGSVGDFVCRSVSDPNDVWIVRRGLFTSTYERA